MSIAAPARLSKTVAVDVVLHDGVRPVRGDLVLDEVGDLHLKAPGRRPWLVATRTYECDEVLTAPEGSVLIEESHSEHRLVVALLAQDIAHRTITHHGVGIALRTVHELELITD